MRSTIPSTPWASSPTRLRVISGIPTPVVNVYTYDLVAQVLRDNVTFSSGAIRELMELVMGPFVLVGMDEPEHKRHRGLVSVAFRHKTLLDWEATAIRPIVEEV